MTPKHRTLDGKNRTLGGEGGRFKNDQKNRTSFMDVPLAMWQKFVHVICIAFTNLLTVVIK